MEQQASGELRSAGGTPQWRGAGFVVAIALHIVLAWALVNSISFRFGEREGVAIEPRIVTLAERPAPPPPDVEALGTVDVAISLPRFRPRVPKAVPGREQRRFGDPALAIWKYLCNRDASLSEATRRECPAFSFGEVDLGMRDPLNRGGDVGALLTPDTATMSYEEAGRRKGWFKPKAPWPGDGARAKGNELGLRP